MQSYLKGKSRSDYNAAIKSFCNANSDTTIFLAGEVSHPGISDLDFVVVDKVPAIPDSVVPFLAGGNVIIMPKFAMTNILNLEKFNLKYCQGSSFQFKEANNFFKVVEILEWLPERILKCQQYLKSNASRQDTLLLHKSVNRSIRNVSELTNKNYNIVTTEEARNSSELTKYSILAKSIVAANYAWADFEKYVRQANLLSGHASGSLNISDYYSFQNNFNMLLLYFQHLQSTNFRLSQKLSEKLKIDCVKCYIDPDFEKYIIERWQCLDEIYTWFLDNNIKKGMIKYGWFL